MKIVFLLMFMAISGPYLYACSPANFGSAQITYTGSAIEISWTTISENNNDFFVIERASDSVNFVPIGNIDAAGTSWVTQSYLFTDVNVVAGEDYCYRIKQIDFDGTYTYSPVKCYLIALAVGDENRIASGQISSYPNPVSTNFNISWDYSISFHTLRIYDVTGKQVFQSACEESNQIRVDLSELIQGSYYYQLEGERDRYNGILVKE